MAREPTSHAGKSLFGIDLSTPSVSGLRPGFVAALSQLMATPGARSDDPIFSRSTDQSRSCATPLAVKPLHALKTIALSIPPSPIDLPEGLPLLIEQQHLQQQIEQHLCRLASAMSLALAPQKFTVTLLAPAMLTVKVRGEQYAKHHHIGGESFIATRVTMDCEQRLIFCFRPTSVQYYEQMEMVDSQARDQLQGFRELVELAGSGRYDEELAAIGQLQARFRALQQVAKKVGEYPAFGSF